MKLALGTAQFGLNYGVANTSGQIKLKEIAQILPEARRAGFDTLDTAVSYGNSEERLGKIGVQEWKIISKLPALPDSINDVKAWMESQVYGSLQKLGVPSLDGLLIHHPFDILGQHGEIYTQTLMRIKREGLVNAIGYSIYSPDILDALCAVLLPDIVQAPYNVFDRRLISSGWMKRLVDKGIRIHTRSVFLQGLLLMSENSRPSWFDRWQHLWRTWSNLCLKSGASPLAVSLGYVLSQTDIERVVVGVDSVAQLHQIIDAVNEPAVDVCPQLESLDIELIEPSRWRI